MGRRAQEVHPNVILSRAIYSGLSGLVRLARMKRHRKIRRYVQSIEKNWREAREEYEKNKKIDPYDFSAIKNAEANIRQSFLRILWLTTKRFGNNEFKRVYKWTEGTVGPLNALLNYAGARLRDIAVKYSLPNPEFYQIRKYSDEVMKIFPKSVAEKLPEDDAIEIYWKAGYKGNRKAPRILLSHPTLPSMDFVDIIRPHLVVLCGECFMHSVPRTESHRYIRLLIHRLRRFLDWFYTEGKYGEPNFEKGAYQELRAIISEIRTIHSKRVGRRKSITRELQDEIPELTIKSFKTKTVQMLQQSNNETEKEQLTRTLDLIEQEVIVDRDIEKLNEQFRTHRFKEGNSWHRILLSNLHHPFSLKQVVFAGDKMLDAPSSLLIVGELPISNRSGQIDLTIFMRRELSGRSIYTPIMILELKTKTAFDFNLYGVRSRNKKKREYVPSFYVWKRALTEIEWNGVFSEGIGQKTEQQLNAYEDSLLREYKQIASFDPSPPQSLWKGVIVIDTDQEYSEVFDAFQDLLENLKMKLSSGVIDASAHEQYAMTHQYSQETLHIALLLTQSSGPIELLSKGRRGEPLDENPFLLRIPDERNLTVYVSIPSPTSSGKAAAWISKNWHIVNHIMEYCSLSDESKHVYWIDLLEDFQNELMVKRRFELNRMLKENRINEDFHTELDTFLTDINFIHLGTELDQLLSGDNAGLEGISKQLKSIFSDFSTEESVIVVDGWSQICNLFPNSQAHIVNVMETIILKSLPQINAEIIWVDDGTNHTQMNLHFQCRCIYPLPHVSARRTHLDEVIYNAPLNPRVFGWQAPIIEDVRMIIQDTPTNIQPWTQPIHVPHLKGFSRLYRGASKRDGVVSVKDVYGEVKTDRPMYGSGITLSSVYPNITSFTSETAERVKIKAQTLIPSVLRYRESAIDEDNIVGDSSSAVSNLRYQLTPQTGVIVNSNTQDRLHLCPENSPPHPPHSHSSYASADKIKRAWKYDTNLIKIREEEQKPEQFVVTRPTLVQVTSPSHIDSEEIRKRELERLIAACNYIQRRKRIQRSLRQCCEEISDWCSQFLDETIDVEAFERIMKGVSKIISKDAQRDVLWNQLKPLSLELTDMLTYETRSTLEEIMLKNPNILLLYGNNLFLAVLGALDESFSRIESDNGIALMNSVVEWVLYQIGFDRDDELIKSKYDFRAIYSNLLTRAKNLPEQIEQELYFDWTQDKWKIEYQFSKNALIGMIVSMSTLKPWMNWYFIIEIDTAYSIEDHMTAFIDAVGSVIPLVYLDGFEETVHLVRTEFSEPIQEHTSSYDEEILSSDNEYELIEVTQESSRASYHISVVLDSKTGQRMKLELFELEKPVKRLLVEVDVLEEIIYEKLSNLNLGDNVLDEITQRCLSLFELLNMKL